MNQLFIKFARGLTVYTLIILLMSVAIYYGLPAVKITAVYLYIIAFMYAINFLLLGKLSQAIQNKPNRFINTYMLFNFGKLFLYIAIISVYVYLYRNDAISFTITFFVYYLLFTAYEIMSLLKIKK
jgi:hypothetical protein